MIDQAELEHVGPPGRLLHSNKLCKSQTSESECELHAIRLLTRTVEPGQLLRNTVNDTQSRQFDEQAALRELERLADKIQSTRRERERAEAEFDTFVKTFRHDRYREQIGQHEAALGGTPDRTIGAPRPAVQATVPARQAPPLISVSATAGTERRTNRGLVIAGVAVAAIVVAVWMWRGSSLSVQSPTPGTGPAVQTPATAPPAPASPPAPARALNVELTTLRPVWMRVIVDGNKLMERVVPEGQTIPVGADTTIAIRAGDGGAVRLSVGGKDQGLLGRDGFPANRALSAK